MYCRFNSAYTSPCHLQVCDYYLKLNQGMFGKDQRVLLHAETEYKKLCFPYLTGNIMCIADFTLLINPLQGSEHIGACSIKT